MRKVRRAIAPSFAVCALVVFAACAHAQAPAAPSVPATPPAAAPAPSEGETLLENTCTSCHDLSPVSAHGRTPQAWGDLVDRMMTYGASASDSDVAAIKAYLAATYPPTTTAAPTAAPVAPAPSAAQ